MIKKNPLKVRSEGSEVFEGVSEYDWGVSYNRTCQKGLRGGERRLVRKKSPGRGEYKAEFGHSLQVALGQKQTGGNAGE